MGIIMGALGGLGGAMADIGSTNMKADLALENSTKLAAVNSDLDLKRQQALAVFNHMLAAQTADQQEARRNAPLERIGARAKQLAGEDVPLEAAPVSRLSGAGVQSTNGMPADSGGFDGDPKALLREIMSWPDSSPEKAPALAQLKAQYGADLAAAEGVVAGQKRKRTPDEAFDAALADAKINDPVAYAAGRPLAAEKTITVADGASVIDPRSGKVVFSSAGSKGEREEMKEDRRDARASAAEDARDRRQLAALAAADARAAMMAAGGRVPAGYQRSADGNRLEFIPGGPADPENKGKALPASTAKGLLENQDNLRRAQKALALANGDTIGDEVGDKDATGKKGWVPNQVLNRMDPAGVTTRAAIADLGSMVIHDRSGAAVSATEFPRLQPFVPSEKDDAATVRKKLKGFITNYQAITDDMTEFYKASGYKVPVEVLRDGKGDPAPGASAQPGRTAANAAPRPAVGTIEDGYVFRGGDPKSPLNWKKKP